MSTYPIKQPCSALHTAWHPLLHCKSLGDHWKPALGPPDSNTVSQRSSSKRRRFHIHLRTNSKRAVSVMEVFKSPPFPHGFSDCHQNSNKSSLRIAQRSSFKPRKQSLEILILHHLKPNPKRRLYPHHLTLPCARTLHPSFPYRNTIKQHSQEIHPASPC
jgi:hypothetical protein